MHVERFAGLDARVRRVGLDAPSSMPAQLVDLVVVPSDPGQQPVGGPGFAFSIWMGLDCAAALAPVALQIATVRASASPNLSAARVFICIRRARFLEAKASNPRNSTAAELLTDLTHA